jgi:hypothetical protein
MGFSHRLGIGQILRAALRRLSPAKATMEPSIVSSKFAHRFRLARTNLTIPGENFLPVGNGRQDSEVESSKRLDGQECHSQV